MPGQSHRDVADGYERSAEAHALSAVDLDDSGDPELADLERRSEENELDAADIERARGRLKDDRQMSERLRALLDGGAR
jgi:hypothetical protein